MLPVPAIRAACARVAASARHVAVRTERVAAYADTLGSPPPHPPPAVDLDAPPERRAAFLLACDAVNFGSGWFPTLRKRPGLSGSLTVVHALRDAFAGAGGWDAAAMAGVDAAEVARVLGQDADHELMAVYATHLAELGCRVESDFGGSFLALAQHPRMASELSRWPGFADVSRYDGLPVPFFKRAQLTAYDMACAGFVPPGAEGELTMFADNLVPHVLRVDGILEYAPDLLARIASGALLEHGSPEEVEIRACGLHAVELIVDARPELSAPGVDAMLWHRGQDPRYKAQPRHRARSRAY